MILNYRLNEIGLISDRPYDIIKKTIIANGYLDRYTDWIYLKAYNGE